MLLIMGWHRKQILFDSHRETGGGFHIAGWNATSGRVGCALGAASAPVALHPQSTDGIT